MGSEEDMKRTLDKRHPNRAPARRVKVQSFFGTPSGDSTFFGRKRANGLRKAFFADRKVETSFTADSAGTC